MAFTAQAEAPPLREDAAGALRVGNSRVLLELVIRAFQDGATPETIVQRYSTLASSLMGVAAPRKERASPIKARARSRSGPSLSAPRNSS